MAFLILYHILQYLLPSFNTNNFFHGHGDYSESHNFFLFKN